MKRKAVYFTGERRAEVLEEPVPPLPADAVLVETEVSAVSAGTELLFHRGEVPSSMSVDETLPSLGQGGPEYPLKYGYAAVGRVVDVGASVDRRWSGCRVFAFHPHESYFHARPADLVVIPPELGSEAAALLPTMETAVSFAMDASPVIGERVVVFGLGMVGLLTTRLLGRMPMGRLVGVDPSKHRRDLAGALGAQVVVDASATDFRDRLRRALGGAAHEGLAPGEADLAFELSGAPSALDEAIAVLGFGGRVLVGSWYGTKPVAVSAFGDSFHRKHVQVRSSQVSRLHPHWAGRWTKARRLRVAMEHLSELDVRSLVSHRIPMAEAPYAYELLAQAPEGTLQILFTYDERSQPCTP